MKNDNIQGIIQWRTDSEYISSKLRELRDISDILLLLLMNIGCMTVESSVDDLL